MKNLKGEQMMEPMKKKILEALQMQPLTEEEKASRHILGRLYGPIATTKDSTRNGRLYNETLWRNALQDEIFLEKVGNKGLFLELGHPLDREEIDMSKACACIPEVPKIVNGDLYAYVDILDTPNGKILKTLCDYGFKPGISSRGSGDVDMNNEVDPETFFLETWDIVNIPAVKKARLSVCESLGQEQLKLRKALVESLNKAEEKDKTIMKEALSNLKITLSEDIDGEIEPEATEEPLVIGDPEIVTTDVQETPEIEASVEEPQEEVETLTVGDIAKQLADFDTEEPVEFAPIIIDDKEYPVHSLSWNENEDGKVVLNVGYDLPMEDDNIDAENAEQAIEAEAEPAITDDAEIMNDEAIDDGANELIDSLKEMIRQKEACESEIKTLKENKAVSDTKVKKLEEELNQYKSSFARLSDLAVEAKQAKKDVQALTEQLNQKDTIIKDLKTKQTTVLSENNTKQNAQVQALTESLTNKETEFAATKKQLTEQVNQFKIECNKRTQVAKAYKAKYLEAVNKYAEMKASMLSVRVSDITSQLNENYTCDDIDRVCEQILANNRPAYGLPQNSRMRIVESKQQRNIKKIDNPDDGYEIDDDLLILAGLK